MKWHPVITDGITQPAIESGPWRISKAQLSPGQYRYALHKHGGEALHFADSVDELKRIASEQR